jgi:hypothetical protein
MKPLPTEAAAPPEEAVQDGNRATVARRAAFPVEPQALQRLAPPERAVLGGPILVPFGPAVRYSQGTHIESVRFR